MHGTNHVMVLICWPVPVGPTDCHSHPHLGRRPRTISIRQQSRHGAAPRGRGAGAARHLLLLRYVNAARPSRPYRPRALPARRAAQLHVRPSGQHHRPAVVVHPAQSAACNMEADAQGPAGTIPPSSSAAGSGIAVQRYCCCWCPQPRQRQRPGRAQAQRQPAAVSQCDGQRVWRLDQAALRLAAAGDRRRQHYRLRAQPDQALGRQAGARPGGRQRRRLAGPARDAPQDDVAAQGRRRQDRGCRQPVRHPLHGHGGDGRRQHV